MNLKLKQIVMSFLVVGTLSVAGLGGSTANAYELQAAEAYSVSEVSDASYVGSRPIVDQDLNMSESTMIRERRSAQWWGNQCYACNNYDCIAISNKTCYSTVGNP